MTTGISWTDETWNPVVGCRNCYAETMAQRLAAIADAGDA